jgi:hypothetical protein
MQIFFTENMLAMVAAATGKASVMVCVLETGSKLLFDREDLQMPMPSL